MNTAEKTFSIPTREEVSANNQAIFDNLQKGLVSFLTYTLITRKTTQHLVIT